jgi:hypothetical protein
MRKQILDCLCVAVAATMVSGCGGCSAPADKPAPVPTAGKPDTPGDPAQEAITAMIKGLNEGHPEAFWEFLPSDYQDDLNGLIHQFAERMDRELWDKAVKVLRKLASVVKSQRKFLSMAAPQSQAIGRAKDADANTAVGDWPGVAAMIDTLLDSELANLDRLKSADGGQLLKTAGGQVLEQLKELSKKSPNDELARSLEQLADLQVSVIHATKDAASLKFEAPGETPLITKFVLHNGKWIPESLESEWLHSIGNTRAWMSAALTPEAVAEQKARYLSMLSAVDAAFDEMGAAKTAEEFKSAGERASLAMVSLWFAVMTPAPNAEPDATPRRSVDSRDVVTIVVAGMLDEDAQNALRDRLKGLADEPDRAAAEITGDDETSTFKVGPVADVEAFATRLDFLKITRVDTEIRTITARLKK